MVNAVHAVASSLVSVKPCIIAAEYISSQIIKLVFPEDIAIVSRLCYFDNLPAIDKYPFQLTDCQLACILQAERCFAAEKQACVYLNRAEHSAYQLTIKLQKKGFTSHDYRPVLTYLKEKELLNDSRFAAAWLHTRSLSKHEGYQRLFFELRKRGIDSSLAKHTLDIFFAETDEYAICIDVTKYFLKKGYEGQKLFRALYRKGFSYSIIKQTLEKLAADTVYSA